jgi:hypothetical protein
MNDLTGKRFGRLVAIAPAMKNPKGMKIYNSTGRCSDLRKALKPHLMDIKARRIHDGLFEYKLT